MIIYVKNIYLLSQYEYKYTGSGGATVMSLWVLFRV
jgi:hypothetical protein